MAEEIAKRSTAYALARTQLPIEIPVNKDYPAGEKKKNPSYLHPKKYRDITKCVRHSLFLGVLLLHEIL